MRLYLAGPMSGYQQFNFPAFDAAAAKLREQGYEVVSPAELDSPKFRARVLTAIGTEKDLLGEWGNCLARDVKLIADSGIEAIVLLRDWHKSRGAKLEAFIGLLCRLKFGLYDPGQIGFVMPIERELVIRVISEHMK
jgi:hypothetical protein